MFEKKIAFLRFSPEFQSSNIFAVTEQWAYSEPNFFEEISKKILFNMFTWVLLDGFLNGFSKFGFFKVEICILIWDFWVILSIRGNDFIAHWAYEDTISSHTEHTPNEFSRMLSQRKNVNSFYMYSYAEHTGKWFYRTLNIRGNDLNAGWAYEEMISSLTEHSRKCLKVEYFGRTDYYFQKSRVTGPWEYMDPVSAKKVIKKCHACIPLKGQCHKIYDFRFYMNHLPRILNNSISIS